MTFNEFERHYGWTWLSERNEAIARFLKMEPKIWYAVAHPTEDAIVFACDREPYENAPEMQKFECQRWLDDYRRRCPNSYVVNDGYIVKPFERWPNFHIQWDQLMPAIEKAAEIGIKIELSTVRHEVWQRLWAAVELKLKTPHSPAAK